eukprot:9258323-Alexandrium_andersonii.AAC.1
MLNPVEAPTPTTNELQKLDGEPLGAKEASQFRTVTCKLLHVMEDYPAPAWRCASTGCSSV